MTHTHAQRIGTLSVLVALGLLGAGNAASALPYANSISFQQGVDGYTGTADSWVGDGVAHGSDDYLYWQRDFSANLAPVKDYRPVIRFDNALTTLPAGAFITRATLELTRDASSEQIGSQGFNGQMIGGMVPVTAAWNNASTTVSVSNPGIGAVSNAFGQAPTMPDAATRPFDVTAFARAWSDGSLANHGLSFVESNNQRTNVAFHSSEATTTAYRPKLTVDYVKVHNPIFEKVIVIREGLNGYASTADTFINQALTQQATNYGSQTQFVMGRNQGFSQGGNDYAYTLLRFDDVHAQLDTLLGSGWQSKAVLNAALLGVGKQSNQGIPAYLTAYPMLQSWTENGATWLTRDGVNAWANPFYGQIAAPPPGPGFWPNPPTGVASNLYETLYTQTYHNPQIGPNGPINHGIVTFDVTNTVDGWLLGNNPNLGWMLSASPYLGNYNGFVSSEGGSGFTQYARPELILILSIPEPASATLLAVGALAMRRRRM